mmetsp:Transcript_32026/g.83829  ORF Transcript_32026/g.83829 Transcript_32026/m.83829 type:complete len:209 (-) Transcript_32026:1690-2316(-)
MSPILHRTETTGWHKAAEATSATSRLASQWCTCFGAATPSSAGPHTRSLVDEFDLQHIALLDLADVVHDELVVQQRRTLVAEHFILGALAKRHLDVWLARKRRFARRLRRCATLTPRGVSLGLAARLVCLELGCRAHVRCAQRHFGEQQHAVGLLPRGEAVVGGFARHVGKVDSLSKHVASAGRLGRCNAQALRDDAAPVRQPGAMPE